MTARLPYPVIGGDRLKPYYLLSHLAKNHNVTLISFYQGSKIPVNYVNAIEKLGVKVFVIKLNPMVAGLKTFAKITNYPLEIAYYYHSDFQKTVDKIINDNHIDLAFSFFMRTAEYIKNKKLPKVLIAEDCRTLYQKRSYEESSNLKHKIVRWWEYTRLKTYEPNIVNYFDLTTLVSEADIDAMKKQNPNANYELLTNGTDIDKFKPKESIERKGILFAGKMDVWANVLMVKTIVKNILPIIKKEIPDAKLKIVGANPPQNILSLKSDSISIEANVPDMIPYLQKAQVFLHPHTGGSGIQNKLLEAMSCACPVVTTPTGNQGINAVNGKEVLIGDDFHQLAQHTINILKNKELAKSISDNARELIINTHSWESVFMKLDKIIDEVLGKEK